MKKGIVLVFYQNYALFYDSSNEDVTASNDF